MIKRMLKFINQWIPIYSKDDLYEYSFDDNSIRRCHHMASRKYEMVYYNDHNDCRLIAAYSKYLSNYESGILEYSYEEKKIKSVKKSSNQILSVRLYNDTIYYLEKMSDHGEITLKDEFNRVLMNIGSSDFEIFSDESKDYMVIGDDLYDITAGISKGRIEHKICFEDEFPTRNNISICCQSPNNYYLVCRVGEKQAFGTAIALYHSTDLKNWEFERFLVDSKKLRWLGIDGVGFPTIRYVDQELKMFFSAFWGHHLLRPLTVKYWRNVI